MHKYTGGKKFDLRLYALVTSFSPLRVYQYRRGFARFSNSHYNSDIQNIYDSFIHLTNVAIQKTGQNYDSLNVYSFIYITKHVHTTYYLLYLDAY